MSLQIRLWGIRGSLPAPYPPAEVTKKVKQAINEFADSGKTADEFISSLSPVDTGGFGGHTACIQVSSPEQTLIIDGGSGIRRLGEQLVYGPCGKGAGEVHILFTHFHWDHIIGLPFFVPLFIPGNKIHIYSVQPDTEKVFRHIFQKPFFPVPYESLGSEIIYHQLKPRQATQFSDISVTPYQLDHPDPCWGFKFEYESRAFSYCVDTEATRVSRDELGEDLPLYQNVEVMIFDAQYTLAEAAEKVNWGHAAAPIGIDLAMREGVKQIYFVHHDPAASDIKIKQAEHETRVYYDARVQAAKKGGLPFHEVNWEFAHEGMLIEL